jgi:hypothetical protein
MQGRFRILADDSNPMKKTLFFWKPVYRGISWMGDGLKAFWMVAMKFYFSPTEKNLVVSFWYDYQHFRRVQPDKSSDEYLDSRVREIKRNMADLARSVKSRQLNGDLLQALENKRIRSMFVSYLDSPSPREDYRRMAATIRGAWRAEGAHEVNGGADLGRDVVNERVVEAADEGGVDEVNEAVESKEPSLHAKAYVIAAQLCFEAKGKGLEFDAFSQNIPELIKFVREQFGVEKLPGTFEKFKGYSYKLILKERSGTKKGQLKMPFRQIRDHPEVFGEEVAARANEILKNNLR